jgi:hypothetical protein
MSVYSRQSLPCSRCGVTRTVDVVDSANPYRHPPFLDALLDRSFNRFRCKACGHVDVAEGPMLWTDVQFDLVAWLLPRSRRISWTQLEIDVEAGLRGPVRNEGPAFVQAWGRGACIRLVFGLEELREKAVARRHLLNDAVVEVLKLPYVDLEQGTGPVLESVDEEGLRLVAPPRPDGTAAGSVDERTLEVVSWPTYERRVARSEDDALQYPGLFRGTWVNWGRAPYAPRAYPAPVLHGQE